MCIAGTNQNGLLTPLPSWGIVYTKTIIVLLHTNTRHYCYCTRNSSAVSPKRQARLMVGKKESVPVEQKTAQPLVGKVFR